MPYQAKQTRSTQYTLALMNCLHKFETLQASYCFQQFYTHLKQPTTKPQKFQSDEPETRMKDIWMQLYQGWLLCQFFHRAKIRNRSNTIVCCFFFCFDSVTLCRWLSRPSSKGPNMISLALTLP